ncbi:MAG: deoxyribonuclease IV [Verrucomicrobiae bacterium]|nr:deoxyribonuclease IV [Verrucomicrobiae bacterium]
MADRARKALPSKSPQPSHPTDFLGSHVSVAGGVVNAFERGRAVGCAALQVFTKSNFQWAGHPLHEDEVRRFREALAGSAMPIGAHSGYLINLGAAGGPNLKKSIDSTIEELVRAHLLGIPFVVLHPGSHLGGGEEAGLKRIAQHLKEIFSATRELDVKIALETTAGQGSCLGGKFEHLAELYRLVNQPERLAVCFDTCHVFAAGYDFARQPDRVLEEFDRVVGLGEIVMFHFNDSKGERGSRLDRHEHIGEGKIGLDAFRVILRDRRFERVPKILETPKDKTGRLDRKNLKVLRSLMSGEARPRASSAAANRPAPARARLRARS